jgi:hypothetical protein
MVFKNNTKINKKQKMDFASSHWARVLMVAGLTILPCCLFFGFVYLDRYVKKAVPVAKRTGLIQLVEPPWWLNDALKERIYAAATANGEELKLDEDAAKSVRCNLEKAGGWLDNVKVQTTWHTFRIRAKWRKPLAVIKGQKQTIMADADRHPMDYVEVPNLPVVNVVGFAEEPGSESAASKKDDIAAAVAILDRLDRRDSLEGQGRGLLYEIAKIDVSNFNGRKSAKNPHIVLYATDGTEIIWGAELGKWYRHLEVTDEQKIARLYSYFYEKGTLLGGAKVINLRDPKETVPLPIDKYVASEN